MQLEAILLLKIRAGPFEREQRGGILRKSARIMMQAVTLEAITIIVGQDIFNKTGIGLWEMSSAKQQPLSVVSDTPQDSARLPGAGADPISGPSEPHSSQQDE
ncbi:hypothetical protein AB5N19_05208 [Seiridium cardinale]